MKPHALIAISFIFVAGCSQAPDKGAVSPALATVNGAPITAVRFSEKLKFLRLGFSNVSAGGSSGADAKFDLLSQAIEDEMYLQEAGRLHIAATGADVDKAMKKVAADYPAGVFEKTLTQAGLDMPRYRAEMAGRLTVQKLIESEVYSKVRVSGAQAMEYYRAHQNEFHRPYRVRARQIVVDTRKGAEEILSLLKRGADFASLARSRSFSPDSETGGDLGYFSRGEMPPEFEKAVFGMRPGRISGVVKTQYGYHIFKVEDIQKAGDPSFREVEADVRRRLAKELGEEAFGKWQAALKARTKIEVNFEVLKKL